MTRSRSIWFGVALVVAALGLTSCGCSVRELGKFKEHHGKGDYNWIAQQKIPEESDEACIQLRLVKGDACFRLAKDGKDAKEHYTCAAENLEAGIKETKDWKQAGFDMNKAQTYENLFESLRNLQDMEKGQTAEELTMRLLNKSQEFLTEEPGNLGGIYYKSSAKYTLLRKDLLHPAGAAGLCNKLNGILTELKQAEPKTRATHYEENYKRLILDVTGAKKSIPGCM